jgi:hypothetical protein
MTELPQTLEQAIAQAKEATVAAIKDGCTKLQVELLFPELKSLPVAQQFIPAVAELDKQLRVFFPDAGACALARREWGEVNFKIDYLGTNPDLVAGKVRSEDEIFLAIEPSAVEVSQAEKLCQAADPRPVVLLMPRLEDAAIVGIGYAGRQLRERFLNTLESCYYIRPLDNAAVFRCYPSPWQVWRVIDDNAELIAELPEKPVGDALLEILTGSPADTNNPDLPQVKRPGLLANLQQFLRALSS